MSFADLFQYEFPDIIEHCLEGGFATCCAFNRRGTLMAVGCNSGQIVIWDFDTRGIAKTLDGHQRPVSSVSWSRNGRKLLTGCGDRSVRLWDVVSGHSEHTERFETNILRSQIHSKKSESLCGVCDRG
eukprot:TRINITY_DN21031_c0_g1_i1.p1 TRINITY_DN21031_c0_g1~~TRINITY_DN21031_c0_g1_i1.p1  ORF type:complete len:128 (-),score=16.26 TRINITY_DN21031_c0_g1_i1:20-403(-)